MVRVQTKWLSIIGIIAALATGVLLNLPFWATALLFIGSIGIFSVLAADNLDLSSTSIFTSKDSRSASNSDSADSESTEGAISRFSNRISEYSERGSRNLQETHEDLRKAANEKEKVQEELQRLHEEDKSFEKAMEILRNDFSGSKYVKELEKIEEKFKEGEHEEEKLFEVIEKILKEEEVELEHLMEIEEMREEIDQEILEDAKKIGSVRRGYESALKAFSTGKDQFMAGISNLGRNPEAREQIRQGLEQEEEAVEEQSGYTSRAIDYFNSIRSSIPRLNEIRDKLSRTENEHEEMAEDIGRAKQEETKIEGDVSTEFEFGNVEISDAANSNAKSEINNDITEEAQTAQDEKNILDGEKQSKRDLGETLKLEEDSLNFDVRLLQQIEEEPPALHEIYEQEEKEMKNQISTILHKIQEFFRDDESFLSRTLEEAVDDGVITRDFARQLKLNEHEGVLEKRGVDSKKEDFKIHLWSHKKDSSLHIEERSVETKKNFLNYLKKVYIGLYGGTNETGLIEYIKASHEEYLDDYKYVTVDPERDFDQEDFEVLGAALEKSIEYLEELIAEEKQLQGTEGDKDIPLEDLANRVKQKRQERQETQDGDGVWEEF